MEYIERREGGTAVYRLMKPLARGNYHDLPGKLMGEFEGKGATGAVVDLSDVEFMDTTGLNTLLTLLEIAKKYNGRFSACGAGESVRAALDRLMLASEINLQADVEKAVAYCGGH